MIIKFEWIIVLLKENIIASSAVKYKRYTFKDHLKVISGIVEIILFVGVNLCALPKGS